MKSFKQVLQEGRNRDKKPQWWKNIPERPRISWSTLEFKDKPLDEWMEHDVVNWIRYVEKSDDPNESRSTSDGKYQSSSLTPGWPQNPVGYLELIRRLKKSEFSDEEIVKLVNKVYISLGEQQIRIALKHNL